jgi:hypothetical protein
MFWTISYGAFMAKCIAPFELTLGQRPKHISLTGWLHGQLRAAILDGRLQAGTKLSAPGLGPEDGEAESNPSRPDSRHYFRLARHFGQNSSPRRAVKVYRPGEGRSAITAIHPFGPCGVAEAGLCQADKM